MTNDDRELSRWLFYLAIVFILFIFGLGLMVVEAQNSTCYPFNKEDIERDVTDDMMAIYDLFYRQYKQTEANQLFNESYQQYFRWGLGQFQSADGLWLDVTMYNDQSDGIFFVYVGKEWTLGADGAVHSPCGIYILNRFKRSEWN